MPSKRPVYGFFCTKGRHFFIRIYAQGSSLIRWFLYCCLYSRWGRKIGLIGLVEKEWLDTLATINPEEVTYTDYVTAGTMLAKELKEQKGCEVVIALTHMRTHNDIRYSNY